MNVCRLPLILFMSSLPDTPVGFFAKTRVVTPFPAERETRLIPGVASVSLCAAECDGLAAYFFTYEPEEGTCTVVLTSKTLTTFWYATTGQGDFTEVYASRHLLAPGTQFAVTF